MSSHHTSSTSSSSYTSYSYSSSSSTTAGGQQHVTGSRSAQASYTDPSGNTYVQSAHQNLGQPAVTESRTFDRHGREMIDAGGSGNVQRRIEDVSDNTTQAERDRLYEERIEDEYAKREGGA